MVSAGYQLGSGVFRSLRVWVAALVLTFAFCEGAGFGAFSYRCTWYDPFSAAGPQCTLAGQMLFPTATSWATFAWDAAIGIASRLSSPMAMRIFSFLPIAVGCAILCVAGYDYEIHATLATGLPQVRL